MRHAPFWKSSKSLKCETELTASILRRKKRSETHKRLNRMLFNQTKQDRMQIFKVFGSHFWSIFWSHAYNIPEEPNWQQLWFLFVFVLFVALNKRILYKICILSCFVSLKSVLFSLLCVFDHQNVLSFNLHADPMYSYKVNNNQIKPESSPWHLFKVWPESSCKAE